MTPVARCTHKERVLNCHPLFIIIIIIIIIIVLFQVMNTLKTSLQPVISDISLDWTLPGGVEVLQTPANPPPIKPGEPLVIYGLLCDTVRMHSTLASVLQKGERRNPFGSNLSRNSSSDQMTDKMEPSETGDGTSVPRSPNVTPKTTAPKDKGNHFMHNRRNRKVETIIQSSLTVKSAPNKVDVGKCKFDFINKWVKFYQNYSNYLI